MKVEPIQIQVNIVLCGFETVKSNGVGLMVQIPAPNVFTTTTTTSFFFSF